ncbi:MAG: ribosome maturation factor RimM [Bacteroidota bacterium]
MMDTVQIGYTKKAFGVKGELKLSVEDHFMGSLEEIEVLFLELGGRQVPYFVEWIRLEHNTFVKFEEVDSKETASRLSSKKLFVRKEDLREDADWDEGLVFGKYKGYKIQDEQLGVIGQIARIEAFPQQEMAMVEYQGKEIMIPMHENLISRVDELLQILWMNLPEGILDLS